MMVRQRRYETVDSGRQYENYSRPQNSNQGPVNRYDSGRPSLQMRTSLIKAKIIAVYTNGERYKNDKSVNVTFSVKRFPDLEPLFKEILDRKAKFNNSSVDCLYSWPKGELIESVYDIEEDPNTTIYVCSDRKEKLYKKGNYGKIPHQSSSVGGSAFTEKYSRNSQLNGGQSNTLKVTSAATGEEVSIFIDKKSQQPYEGLLENIRGMFGNKHPKIVTLYTMSKHPKKINSVSAIKRALEANEDKFWACGEHDEPGRKMSRDTSPKRNGYKQKQKNGDRQKQNGYYGDRDSQSNGRQSDEHFDQHGRSYQRYQEDDDDDDDMDRDEDFDQEPSSPPQRRGGRHQDQSPKRDNRKASNQRRRYDEDESPRRDSKQTSNRRSIKRDDDEDEDAHGRRNGRPPRREQTPPRKGRKDSERSDDNACEDDDDDDDEERKYEHPSEEEMQKRIEEMSEPDPDQDKDVKY